MFIQHISFYCTRLLWWSVVPKLRHLVSYWASGVSSNLPSQGYCTTTGMLWYNMLQPILYSSHQIYKMSMIQLRINSTARCKKAKQKNLCLAIHMAIFETFIISKICYLGKSHYSKSWANFEHNLLFTLIY